MPDATDGSAIDVLDARLLALLTDEPRIGVLECSRRLGVARGTVQARLDRLQRRGVIRGFGPDVDPRALGYGVTAFAFLQIRQGRGESVARRLGDIPEVLEVHTVTGEADLLVRVVARSNDDLQRVIDTMVAADDIERTATHIALTAHLPYRTRQLLAPVVAAADGSAPTTRGLSR